MNKNDKYNNEDLIIKKANRHKLFASIITGQRFFNFTEGLVKLKKYNIQKRGELLTRLYKNYFNSGSIIQDAKMEAYQNHYESFMYNDERNEVKYSEILAYCIDNKNYLYFISLINNLEDMEKQGLDINKLPETNQKFVQKTLEVKKDCVFDKNFPYEEFYTNSDLRKNIAQKLRFYLIDVEKIDKKNQEISL